MIVPLIRSLEEIPLEINEEKLSIEFYTGKHSCYWDQFRNILLMIKYGELGISMSGHLYWECNK